jgi:hypothetical protein
MFLDDKIENNFNNFYHSNNNNIKSNNEYVNNNNTTILSNSNKSYFVTPNTDKYTYTTTKYRSKNIYPKSKNK